MFPPPDDADQRRDVAPVICYPTETLPRPDMGLYCAARAGARKVDEVLVPPRDAACFRVSAGQFFRISSVEGPQVVLRVGSAALARASRASRCNSMANL